MNEELEKAFGAVDKKLRKVLSEFEYKLLLQYKTSLKELRYLLAEVYRKFGDNVDFTEMAKYKRLESLEQKVAQEIEKLSGVSVNLLTSQFKAAYGISTKETINAVNEVIGLKMKFAEFDPKVISEAIKNPYDRVGWKFRTKSHHAKAIEQVKSEITHGLITGRGYSKTAAEITNRVNGLANNVVRIVRTESHRITVKSRNEVLDKSIINAKDLGIELVKVISSVLDNRTRPQSVQMHGQVADKNGLFTYPNGVKGLPGSTGVPEYDINDRETVVLAERHKYQ